MIIDINTIGFTTETLEDDIGLAEPNATIWIVPQQTTFRFKALCSRLRNEFSPQVDCYPDPRATNPVHHVDGAPLEPARLSHWTFMKPNFEWIDVCYRINIQNDLYTFVVELSMDGVPTGRGFLFRHEVWSPNHQYRSSMPYQFSRVQAVPDSVYDVLLRPNGEPNPLNHGRQGRIREDLFMPGFRHDHVDLIPITEFGDDWNPRASTIRYRNMESRRAVQSGWGNPRKQHGPSGQPAEGFSAKQFVARYCGGGYQVPHGARDFITIGTNLVYTKGKTARMRRHRGYLWNRVRTV